MTALIGLLCSLAVVAIAGGGFAIIAGQSQLRDRCLGVGIVCIILALALPLILQLITKVIPALPMATTGNSLTPGVGLLSFFVGHLVLGLTLLHRRQRGQRRDDDLEGARTRGRPRLSPENEEPES